MFSPLGFHSDTKCRKISSSNEHLSPYIFFGASEATFANNVENMIVSINARSFLPRRGYCVGGSRNRCSSVRPFRSVSFRMSRNLPSDWFCDHLRTNHEVWGSQNGSLPIPAEQTCVSTSFELFDVTCTSHI